MDKNLFKTLNNNFWNKKRILLTGHTGFKGSWIALLLESMGAEVYGVSLQPNTDPSLYEILKPWANMTSVYCDIRDRERLAETVATSAPEIVIHMAAQPLVRESYHKPVETFDSNIMGTVHLLEALRSAPNLAAVLVITSDKVYANDNSGIAMTESSPLGGHDPYSASKAATEIVTASYAKSFFSDRGIPVCTVRAGNVIGGGDWAKDRIIPDLWRAYSNNQPVELRYPEAVRPWQHVLDPIHGYLLYLEHIILSPENLPKSLNFGPPTEITRTVLDLAERFSEALGAHSLWTTEKSEELLQESKLLSIDSSLAKLHLGWKAVLDTDSTILWTCEWYKAYRDGSDMREFSNKQIKAFFELFQKAVLSAAGQIKAA